jgi:NAD(P)-dependent dehydrogenase (short-subunit alcohol dehydrogenase family)
MTQGKPVGKLAGKLALVTGASRGLGRAVAQRFAAEGAHVIAVARTVGGLEELDDAIKADAAAHNSGGTATLVPLDLTDFDAIDRMGQALHDRFGRLDVLVGNAASLGVLSPLTHLDPPVWQDTIDLNLTANWRLLRSMDPLLRAAPAGRAIFVTSGITQHPRAFWGPYAISKAALEAMVRIYADEIAHTQVRANLINPGPMRTAMRAKAFPGEKPESVRDPAQLTDAFVSLAQESCSLNGQWVAADEGLHVRGAAQQ